IKIDTDGHELNVLRSGLALLANARPALLVETHSIELERDCIALLEELQYRCEIIKNAWFRIIIPERRGGHNMGVFALPSSLAMVSRGSTDALTVSGFDNGQPFPSINSMDNPATNADGSTEIYFGPTSLGDGKNWLRTLPDKDYFVILRLYGPTKPFFNSNLAR